MLEGAKAWRKLGNGSLRENWMREGVLRHDDARGRELSTRGEEGKRSNLERTRKKTRFLVGEANTGSYGITGFQVWHPKELRLVCGKTTQELAECAESSTNPQE